MCIIHSGYNEIFKKFLFAWYLAWIFCLCTTLIVPSDHRGKKGLVRSHGAGDTDGCVSSCESWEWNSGPLQEYQVLLTPSQHSSSQCDNFNTHIWHAQILAVNIFMSLDLKPSGSFLVVISEIFDKLLWPTITLLACRTDTRALEFITVVCSREVHHLCYSHLLTWRCWNILA